MRGVPSLMRPRMTSSLPPAVSLDNRGPKVRALICGGRWQIPQDWAKTWRPNFCVAVNSSPVLACCADAPPAASTPKQTAERTAERIAALRFILDPPGIAFGEPTPARRQAEGSTQNRAACPACVPVGERPKRRLIELVQGIGAGTLPTVCAGAHAPRRVKRSLKMGCPRCCRGLLFLA